MRVSSLEAVVIHKVRVINDLLFEVRNRAKNGGLNRDTGPDVVPRCLCATALPKFLEELVSLRQKYPAERILMSKADVSDAFRNVRVHPDQAHNLCYTVGDLVVIDFRLTFGWSGFPGHSGVMAAAAEHSHCHTSLDSVQLLSEGQVMMAHAKVVDRWEEGTPTPVPADATVRAHQGEGELDAFFTAVYMDGYLLVKVQHSDYDRSTLAASASLAFDHVRLFGPGAKTSTDWDTTIDALGFSQLAHPENLLHARENRSD